VECEKSPGGALREGRPGAARRALIAAGAVAAVKLAVHLVTNGQYGWFRDELYMRVVGRHLAWGYPDHPPLVALLSWLAQALAGDSLEGFRFLPALAGALTILLAGLLAAELGGGALAAALAGIGILAAPVYLTLNTLFSMNAFEPLFWMGVPYCGLRALRGRPDWWLAAGACAGLGLMNKHSMAFLLAALLAGLAASPQRAVLRERKLWLGLALALAIFLPNLLWQWRNDWATLELLSNVRRTNKNVVLAPHEFLAQQVLLMMPLGALVWGAGLWKLLRGREVRWLGFTYVFLLALMMALKAKNYYLAPIYPLLFAAGGVWWERRRRAAIAVAAACVAGGVALAPVALPVLPPHALIEYMARLRLNPPKTEVAHAGPLPQHFGDMFGWPEQVEAVARVYHSLAPAERERTVILAGNYGQAGAIDLFGPRHGLPKAVVPHQSYWLWGPGDLPGETIIVLQRDGEAVRRYCAASERGPRVGHPYAMAEEHYDIWICRGPRETLQQAWPRMKHWN
jgi:4-amino-4-deoxy-L-arabinose transferase-like glycosyltransferase